VRGRLTPPPSKSVTNRYLTLALLARRPLTVERPLVSDDIARLTAALQACGFTVTEGPERLELVPGPPPAGGEIFCGASGTMLRFLTAALAAVPGRWRLDGIPRLRERPVGPLVEALRRLGARIDCPRREGFAPLTIEGGSLGGGRTGLDAGSSSQYLSALLMAALAAPEETTVETRALTSEPYVEITLQAVEAFGGRIERLGREAFRVYPSRLAAERLRVEGDDSAACYPAAAAALTGGEVTLLGLAPASHQGDRGFLAVLEAMGARVAWHGGEVTVTGGQLGGVEVDLSPMPDQVPTLAALAPFAAGTTRIVNVPHLRLKESDRLAAMAAELGRAGAAVTEEPAGLVVPGVWAAARPPAEPVVLESHGDHRIAMACALVGLRRPGVSIASPGVVGKSYPGFWRDLAGLLGS
jgi:3-phosphoshikimate 1-carboxyvinyltransferase